MAAWSCLLITLGVMSMTTITALETAAELPPAWTPRIFSPEPNCEGQTDGELIPRPDPHGPTSPGVKDLVREVIGELVSSGIIGPNSPRAGAAEFDTRTSHPGIKSPELWTLSDCFAADWERSASRRKSGTWTGYRTLLKAWNAWDASRDVRTLTPRDLQDFFESQTQWASFRSWDKNHTYLLALLGVACPQTRDNPYGVPRGEFAPLSPEQIPMWNMPPPKWFKGRVSSAPRSGHRRRNLPLLTLAEFDKVLLAAGESSDPVYWRTLESFWWFCGMRCRDTVLALRWRTATVEGVDLKSQTLFFRETKADGLIAVPLPSWLCVGLAALAEREQEHVFQRSPHWKNLGRWLYGGKAYQGDGRPTIWQRAGVDLREPHEMRGVSISNWIEHGEKYRLLVTGHAGGEKDIQKRHYWINEKFREAAEQMPRPSVALV